MTPAQYLGLIAVLLWYIAGQEKDSDSGTFVGLCSIGVGITAIGVAVL